MILRIKTFFKKFSLLISKCECKKYTRRMDWSTVKSPQLCNFGCYHLGCFFVVFCFLLTSHNHKNKEEAKATINFPVWLTTGICNLVWRQSGCLFCWVRTCLEQNVITIKCNSWLPMVLFPDLFPDLLIKSAKGI